MDNDTDRMRSRVRDESSSSLSPRVRVRPKPISDLLIWSIKSFKGKVVRVTREDLYENSDLFVIGSLISTI